jgi:LacI family transcriptional regulator
MSRARVGIRDVAAAAGVSMTTVSHVLNNAEGKRVNEATRARVRAVAASLGYMPNPLARGLRLRRSQTIGLISDEIATTPYAGKIILGAQEALAAHGSLLMVMNTSGDQELEEREARLLVRHVDGVLLASMFHREIRVPAALAQVPVVLLDAVSADQSIPSVVPDEVAGGRAAVDELLAAGHRRVAFINNSDDIPAAPGRLAGFLAGLSSAGIPPDDSFIVHCPPTPEDGYQQALRLLNRPDRPTGMFCFSDRMAMGAYQAAADLGLRIPADLSIVGFDNLELIADALRPGLTTVSLPHYEMGVWAVEQMYAQLDADADNEAPAPARHEKLTGPVVRRSSVAPPRRA